MKIQDLKELNKERMAKAQQTIKSQDNFVMLADSISKSLKNIDPKQYKEVSESLRVLSNELKGLPGIVEKLNKQDSEALLGSMEAIKVVIEGKNFSPNISVKSPETPRIDVTPIVKALDGLKDIVKKQEVKDDSKETDRIVAAMNKVGSTISNLSFPVPNYVLPFTNNSTGKSAQANIDEDGSLFVQNGSSFKDNFSGSSLDTTDNWDVVQSDGTTGQSVANSLLSITAGTTNGAYIAIRSKRTFKLPFRIQVIASLSQRIANNRFSIEMVNAAGTEATALATTAVSAGVTQAAYAFSSTTATSGTVVAQNQGVKGTADTTVTIATTANQSVYEMDCKIDSIDWQTRTTDVASASSLNATKRDRTILDRDEEYYLQLRSLNTGVPASGTTWNIESVLVENVTKLAVDITGGRGNISANRSLPVSIVAGTVTTVTTVTTLTNITNWGNIVDNAAFTDGTTRLSPSGYIFDEVAGTALTENDAAAARVDSKRAQVFTLEDETTRGQRATISARKALKIERSHAYNHISSATTTTAKSGAGILRSIVVNTTAAGTITVYDNTAGSGTVIAVLKASIVENSYIYDLAFTTGLTIVTAAASDLTVVYE